MLKVFAGPVLFAASVALGATTLSAQPQQYSKSREYQQMIEEIRSPSTSPA